MDALQILRGKLTTTVRIMNTHSPLLITRSVIVMTYNIVDEDGQSYYTCPLEEVAWNCAIGFVSNIFHDLIKEKSSCNAMHAV